MSTPLQICKLIANSFRVLAVLLVFVAPISVPNNLQAQENQTTQVAPEEETPQTSEPEKDWRKELGVFRIGVIAGLDADTRAARMEPFRLSLEETLKMRVEIFPARNYRALIEAIEASRVEYAILSATAFATVFASCKCAEPLVLPRASDGTFSYQPILVARSNVGASLASISGDALVSTIAPKSPIGSFILSRLAADGLSNDAVKKIVQSRLRGEDALDSFMQKKHDALLGWSSLSGDPTSGYSRGTLRLIAKFGKNKSPNKLEQLSVIWKGPSIPHRPHVVRSQLAPEAKKLLRTQLLQMFDNDPVAYDSVEAEFGGGFVSARQGQFTALSDYMVSLRTDENNPKEEQKREPDASDSQSEKE